MEIKCESVGCPCRMEVMCRVNDVLAAFRESYSGHLKTAGENVLIALPALYRHSPNT